MTPGTNRFVVLDALRGICALLVCLFHFRNNAAILDSAFIENCWQFVDFFFVLSGFVIAANYRQRIADGMSGWRFLGLRLGRIYPLHVVVLLLFVAAELAASAAVVSGATSRPSWDAVHDPAAIITHLLLLQGFWIHDTLTWNAPAWSIGTEFWAYVMIFGIVALTRHRAEAWLVAVVVISPLILLVATPYGINVTYNWGMIRCAYGFALGALCWAVWRHVGPRALSMTRWTAIEIFAVIAVCVFATVAGPTRWNVAGPPLFAVALLVFAHEGGAVSRVLSLRLPLFLGTLSYSIYMLHAFIQARAVNVLTLVERRFGIELTGFGDPAETSVVTVGTSMAGSAAWTGAIMLLTIGTSYLTYRMIELPGQRWSRARFAQRASHGVEASVTEPQR